MMINNDNDIKRMNEILGIIFYLNEDMIKVLIDDVE